MSNPPRYRRVAVLLATLGALLLTAAPAAALTTCVFTYPLTGDTMLLTADCTTDETIYVPDGVTLDGAGYTITAANPAVGDFNGAVVRNATTSAEMHVTNLVIDGALDSDTCDGGDNRLRGILFDRAGGTVTDTTVRDIRQGPASGCQEGNAIEARSFDPATEEATDPRVTVTISDNVVSGYQKTGIVANGGVDAVITRNVVTGDGPVDYIAQNGIQVGFGATALISANTVSGNDYTPTSWFACGIIIVDADGVDARPQDNLLFDNEKDLCGYRRGGNYEPFGR